MPTMGPGGIPYLLPSDNPKVYPTHSQQLAGIIGNGMQAEWVPASGWSDPGGVEGGLWVTRLGPLVVVEGAPLRSGAAIPISPANDAIIGQLPAGFCPLRVVQGWALIQTDQGYLFGASVVTPSGVMSIGTFANGSIETGYSGWINVSFRGEVI